MSTESKIRRPEISKKNLHHISKHRFYELKHLCLQYGEMSQSDDPDDWMQVENIRMALKALPEWIIDAMMLTVTEGFTYESVSLFYGIAPCCRNTYYKYYREFFYILSEVKKSHFGVLHNC